MSEIIERHLEKLLGSFERINPPIDLKPLWILHQQNDLLGMLKWIGNFMGIGIGLQLRVVGPGKPGQASSPMWIEMPSPMPRLGTAAFAISTIKVFIRSEIIERYPFQLIVAGFASLMSRVVLHSIQHPLQDDERAADLAAIIFGFRGLGEEQSPVGTLEAALMLLPMGVLLRPGSVRLGCLSEGESAFAHRWLATNREKFNRSNKSVSQLAHELGEKQHVDDAIALIEKLGGTITEERQGWIFSKYITKILLHGETHEFNSQYDMTQWVIGNVLPTVNTRDADQHSATNIIRY